MSEFPYTEPITEYIQGYRTGFEDGKKDGAREFAEWVAHNRKYNPMKHDIGFAWSDEAHFSTVDEILAEWQKEKIDGTR